MDTVQRARAAEQEVERMRQALQIVERIALDAGVGLRAHPLDETEEQRQERHEVHARIIRALGAALRLYDDMGALLAEYSDLDTAVGDSTYLDDPFTQLEGVLCLVDELVHHHVTVDRGKMLTPVELQVARDEVALQAPA